MPTNVTYNWSPGLMFGATCTILRTVFTGLPGPAVGQKGSNIGKKHRGKIYHFILPRVCPSPPCGKNWFRDNLLGVSRLSQIHNRDEFRGPVFKGIQKLFCGQMFFGGQEYQGQQTTLFPKKNGVVGPAAFGGKANKLVISVKSVAFGP